MAELKLHEGPVTGQALPADACRDSFDVLGALLGEPGAKGRDYLVQQDNGQAGNFGLREGHWKLQRRGGKKKGGPAVALYDLATDPGEQTNVAAKHPDVVKRLTAKLDAVIADGRTRPAE